MPVMGGLELFTNLQKDPLLAKIVFIMLTSSSEANKVTEAVSIGITNYMLKPFSANVLLKHVVKALQK
jgi:two-component system chemotaxis response regulator CheY